MIDVETSALITRHLEGSIAELVAALRLANDANSPAVGRSLDILLGRLRSVQRRVDVIGARAARAAIWTRRATVDAHEQTDSSRASD